MISKILMTLILTLSFSGKSFAEEGHDHDHHEARAKSEKSTSEHGHDHETESESEAEETSSSVGPGKAVEAVDAHDKRFKLSAKAQASIGMKTASIKVSDRGRFSVPAKSIVEFGTEFGVYVVRSGWIQMIEVGVERRPGAGKQEAERVVQSPQLKAADIIAVEGVPLLRAAELEAFGQGGHGHAH